MQLRAASASAAAHTRASRRPSGTSSSRDLERKISQTDAHPAMLRPFQHTRDAHASTHVDDRVHVLTEAT